MTTVEQHHPGDRARHTCEGVKQDGAKCGMINTRRDTTGHWYCRHHMKGHVVAHSGDLDRAMPSAKFRTRQDAERFLEWVIEQGGRGHINAAQVNAMLKAVNMWHKVQERMEEKLIADLEALTARAHDEFNRYREIADSQEGTD